VRVGVSVRVGVRVRVGVGGGVRAPRVSVGLLRARIGGLLRPGALMLRIYSVALDMCRDASRIAKQIEKHDNSLANQLRRCDVGDNFAVVEPIVSEIARALNARLVGLPDA